MIKKITLFLMGIMIVGCNSTKPIVRTTSKSKPKTTTTTTKKKPVAQNSTTKTNPENKTTTSSTNGKEVQLEATSNVRTYEEEIKLYVANFSEIAKSNMKTHGIPASIILAQGILESGAGKGKLLFQLIIILELNVIPDGRETVFVMMMMLNKSVLENTIKRLNHIKIILCF